MASDHTGDPSTFYDVISMLDGSDVMSATQVRAMLQRLHDNTCHAKRKADVLAAKQSAALHLTDANFSDTAASMAAATPFGEEDTAGPVVACKAGQALSVFDLNVTATHPGSSIPNLTSVLAAAVNPAGRIVVVGATTPFCAFKIPGGNWTGGGNQIGGTPTSLVYSPSYGGFLAGRTNSANVFRSTDATSWAGVTALLVGNVQAIGIIGAGPGDGTITVLGTSTSPSVRVSTDDGANYGFSGAGIPNRLTADEAGSLAGCPLVSRENLNRYVYHVSRNDSGARLRTARAPDGLTWESGPTIEPPTGHTFTGAPALKICQSTGLMAITVPGVRTTDAVNVTFVYTSHDFKTWHEPGVYAQVANAAFAVAGGRILMSASAALRASSGVSFGVHT